MDISNQPKIQKSRSEIINAARVSCTKNLNPAGKHKKYQSKTKFTYIKPLIVRMLCSFAIFVAVLTISSLDTKNNTDYSYTIENLITSNTSVESAEDFFVSLLDKISR